MPVAALPRHTSTPQFPAPDHLYLHQPEHGHHRPANSTDIDMTSTSPSGHKPARHRAAVEVLIAATAAAAFGTAATPAFAARATHISPGNYYLDFVIGRGWTEAAYRHWLTTTLTAALLPPPPCRSQGPPGARPEPQPQPNPAPGRTTAARQGPEGAMARRPGGWTLVVPQRRVSTPVGPNEH